LSYFNLASDIDIDVMQPDQTLASLQAKIMPALQEIIDRNKYNAIIAQGDTMTVFCAATIAFYNKIPFFHVEAGLRSYNLEHPFPEEMIRQCASRMAALHFAPTKQSRQNLLKENIPENGIHVTGNTVVDALQYLSNQPFNWNESPLKMIDDRKPIVLVTIHRRENHGMRLNDILKAVKDLATKFSNNNFNMPIGDEITFEKLLQIYKEYPQAGTLALNVKADGLQNDVKNLLHKYNVTDYFMFDMSVPDHIGYIAQNVKNYIRHSEFEQSPTTSNPAMYKKTDGVWLDQFVNPATGICPYTKAVMEEFKSQKGYSWISENVMESHLQQGKNLALVSPELHIWGRDLDTKPYQIIWQQWQEIFKNLAGKGYNLEKIQLCTDFPEQAMEYFA